MSDDAIITGTVFNIQRFTIHDGPGIRTEIFLKGCTLRCKWCSNPESQHPHPEIAVHPLKCIGIEVCGLCIDACPLSGKHCIETHAGKISGINRNICDACFRCSDACPADALTVYGKRMTVRQVVDAVLADRAYYKDRGGVTFSGGEALMQHHFLRQCLAACKEKHIHTCLESALAVPSDHLDRVRPFTDLFIFDLKVMDPAKHRSFTGADNARIHKNARLLAREKMPMIVRIPIIPGHNDDQENITTTARFITDHLGKCVQQVQFLRYRPLGIEKYASLGLPYLMANHLFPDISQTERHINRIVRTLVQMGIPAVAGTTTPLPIIMPPTG